MILIIVAAPFIFNRPYRPDAGPKQAILFVSVQLEEIFGKETTDKLRLDFESLNPDIQIRLADHYGEPDIYIFDDGSYNFFISTDVLIDLNHFSGYETGSRQYAVPLVSFMDLLFYNVNILTAAGFASPPKTRDEFTAYSRIIASRNFGVSPVAFSLNQNDRQALSRDIFSWIWAGGGNFFSDGEKPFLNTRAIVNDLTFFGNLNREGLLAPGIFSTSGEQRLDEFARGRIAMMVASARSIPYLKSRMREGSFGITTIPDSGAGGNYNIGISSIYSAISVNCLYPDEAWKFLEFLAEKSSYLCAELKAVPGKVSNLFPGDYIRDDPFYSKAWEIYEFAQVIEGFSGKPDADEYEIAFIEEFQIFFDTGRTAQATVNAIQRRWDEVYQ